MAPVQLVVVTVKLKQGSGVEEDYVKTLLLRSTEFTFPKGVELILTNQFVQFD